MFSTAICLHFATGIQIKPESAPSPLGPYEPPGDAGPDWLTTP
jgi:hypothetical protein